MLKLMKLRPTATLTLVLCLSLAVACAPQQTNTGLVNPELMASMMANVDESRRRRIASGAEGYMDSVYEYLSAGEPNTAIKYCEEIREIRPNDDAAYIAEGFAYYGKEEYSLAISRFSSALAVDDTRNDARYFRARSYRKTGEYRKALEDLNVVISSQNSAAQILQFYRALNDEDASEETIKGNMYWHQARIYYHLDEISLAKTSVDRAIQYIPNDEALYSDRAYYYFRLQQYPAAYKDYERAIELDPSHSGTWRYAGFIDLVYGRYNKAAMRFQKAHEIDPQQGGILTHYGVAYWLLGDQVKAFELMGKAMRIGPSEETYYHIAYFNHVNGRQDKALEYYTKALELNAQIIQVYEYIASTVPATSPARQFYIDELETAKTYIGTGKTPAAIAQENRSPTFEITGITLVPDPVPVNKSFDFHVNFAVDIPNASDHIIPTVLNFKILRGSKVLHTSKSYFIDANNGGKKKWALHMNPVRTPGTYAIHVTIKHKNMVSEKTVKLLIE